MCAFVPTICLQVLLKDAGMLKANRSYRQKEPVWKYNVFTNDKTESFFLKNNKLKKQIFFFLFYPNINKCNVTKSFELLPLCLESHS